MISALNPTQKIEETLKKTAFFNGCSEDFINQSTSQATLSCANKGKILFFHEDKAKHFYIIQRGWVKLYRETLDGTQAVTDILTDGHIFGGETIFQNNTHLYSAEVIEKTNLISIPLAILKNEIENNPKIAMNMLLLMSKNQQKQNLELEHHVFKNASQRIGCFILRLIDQPQKGQITLHLPYDKTLVASRLHMQPETFSRALLKLKKETGIEVKGSTIKIDNIDRLTKHTCSACSSQFPCKDKMQKLA